MVAGIGVERFKSPVIQDEQVNARKTFQACRDPSIAARDAQLVKQLAEPNIQDRHVVSARLVANGAGQPAFSGARRACNDQIVVAIDPVALEKRLHEPAIESARCAVINIFGNGAMTQFCMA